MDLTLEQCCRVIEESRDQPLWLAGVGSRIPGPAGMASISAPSGIRSFVPEEMTVACGAGTPVDELSAELARSGQYVNLPKRPRGSGTVGGALAVAEGDVYRLGRGSVRDVLLQARVVDGRGSEFKVGGPTVKNVSGFDVCKLLVGSCGRIGLIGEVVLRTRPVPMSTQWYRVDEVSRREVSKIMTIVPSPSCVLWSGTSVDLCIEGHPLDLAEIVDDLHRELRREIRESEEPSLERFGHMWKISPSDVDEVLKEWFGECVAEFGTGVVHHMQPPPREAVHPSILRIEKSLLQSFDPRDRLNGGSGEWGDVHIRATARRRGLHVA